LPVDTTGMVVIHRLIRREFGLLPALIRTATGDATRARRIAAHATEMLDFLHTHHEGEDQLVWPLLRQRVPLDLGLVDRMQQQHQQVADAIGSIRKDLPGWQTNAEPVAGERIAQTIEAMSATLGQHLAEEEARILPLISKHLSQAEWDALADHGFAAIPGTRRLVFLGRILEDTNLTERAHMLAKVPPPARLAFKVIGRRQFTKQTAAIRG
jgi:hemerythrin-like domain-containing protein